MIYTLTLNPALDLELSVTELVYNEVLRATRWQYDTGGKGFNVSRALAALGDKSTALGFVGGSTGQRLEGALNKIGINTDFVYVSGETRTNVSIVTEPSSNYLKVNQPGPTIQPKEVEALIQKIHKLAKTGDYWVLSGSLPPGIKADIYAQIIQVLQSKGAKAVLDTSGEPLRLGCRASPYLVKPNTLEAKQLTGIEIESHVDALAAAEKIRSLGVDVVVISLGAQGALLDNDEVRIMAHPPTVQEHNPIGAGDALAAGLVWGLDQDLGTEEALRWAVACGAAAASLPGTGVGSLEQVKRLVEDVRIVSLFLDEQQMG
jgi:1-phosphofructokinase family hexose kinase